MTIEIHSAELEGLLNQRLADGHFANVEDMLLETLRGPQVRSSSALDDARKTRAMKAAEGIRELRRGITLDRPEGMSMREYAHLGHKY